MKLYTYLPKENTALTDGLLSTVLSDKGFEKYRGRTGKHTKEDVLKVLDSWEPEWTRSKAISALTEPIPPDAAEDFLEFARNHKLYSFDTNDLVKAKILAHIRRARKGGGTDPVDEAKKERPNWHRKKKHLLFQGIPHYFVETAGGKIPPELVTEEKRASAKIDIPSVYDEVRKAYADMGYPVSGDRLVLSEQPTYTNGKPVPADVINPSSSGGNTQDDGTVRINPRYRAVMRHWGLKGPGRDFLRTIIGHELGHHIDKFVLSKPERAEERKRLLREIVKAKFHTVYTDSYGPDTDPRKLDKELLAEYLADMVRRKLEKKADSPLSRNALHEMKRIMDIPSADSNPTQEQLDSIWDVDISKIPGQTTPYHLLAAMESVDPKTGKMLWDASKGYRFTRRSILDGVDAGRMKSSMRKLHEAWPNGVNTLYAAITNMYDRAGRKSGKPVWDVANARPTEYGKMRRGMSLRIK